MKLERGRREILTTQLDTFAKRRLYPAETQGSRGTSLNILFSASLLCARTEFAGLATRKRQQSCSADHIQRDLD